MTKLEEIKEKMKDEYHFIESGFYETDEKYYSYISKQKVNQLLSELEPYLKTEKDELKIQFTDTFFRLMKDELHEPTESDLENKDSMELWDIINKLRELENG